MVGRFGKDGAIRADDLKKMGVTGADELYGGWREDAGKVARYLGLDGRK